ncbi:MAG: CDP-glucose 4,6-dehydratase, partial [Pseudomonadota bacterium]
MGLSPAFWRGRRVLLTGHTGFKGAWAGAWLGRMGAEVTGFALAPQTQPALFEMLDFPGRSIIGDLRDPAAISQAVADADPEIVIHMAAQPLVRQSYADPVETYGTNVMGTVHLLEALKPAPAGRILVVTSDKVYENDETGRAFAEGDRLGGHDPYAASKAATEIVVASYRRSFFAEAGVALATARGGNVIGGGDFSADRLVPDIARALAAGRPVELRNPQATRPWQHVLDCLSGYLTYLEALPDAPAALNFGPADPADALSVAEVTGAMNAALGQE